jgi:hypothetical protein
MKVAKEASQVDGWYFAEDATEVAESLLNDARFLPEVADKLRELARKVREFEDEYVVNEKDGRKRLLGFIVVWDKRMNHWVKAVVVEGRDPEVKLIDIGEWLSNPQASP